MTISTGIRDQIRMMRTMIATQLSSRAHHQSNNGDDEDKEVDRDFGIITMLKIIMKLLMDSHLFQIPWRFDFFI